MQLFAVAHSLPSLLTPMTESLGHENGTNETCANNGNSQVFRHQPFPFGAFVPARLGAPMLALALVVGASFRKFKIKNLSGGGMNAKGLPLAVPVTPTPDTRAVGIASRGCVPSAVGCPSKPGACGLVRMLLR